MEARELHPVGKAEPVRRAKNHVFVDLEILGQDVEHAVRHARFDLQQRQSAVAQLPQAAVDGFEQIVGLVLLNHHVGVAYHAKEVRALDLSLREQLVDVGLDDVFDERERLARFVGHRRTAEPIRQRHESRQLSGTFTRANFVRPL